MKNGEQPAFPVECSYGSGQLTGIQTGDTSGLEIGLTKREYLAAMAMQGILASRYKFDPVVISPAHSDLANDAIRYADELLKQLEP